MTRALRASAGLIGLKELRALGFSEREVRGFVAHGDLVRLHRGVYADGRARPHPRARLKAALMALGEGAFLSGRSAAAVWELRPINAREIEVTVVASSTPRRPGLLVRRVGTDPNPGEVRTRDGLRVSSVGRMLVEVAARETETELERLMTEAIRRDLVNVLELEAVLGRHRCRPGMAKLKRALAAYRPSPGRRSNLERAFAGWLGEHPEIPVPQRNVRLGLWEIDCYWPEQRLAVELDGRAYHIAATDFERDRIKDAWLQRRGIRILRVTGDRFEFSRAEVLNDLLGLLRLPPAV